MPEVVNRSEREKQLANAVALLLQKRYQDYDKLENNSDWQSFQDQLQGAVVAILAGIYRDSADNLFGLFNDTHDDFDPPSEAEINQLANDWATTYSESLAAELVKTTRNKIDDINSRVDEGLLDDDEAQAIIDKLFSDARADVIGITETTRAGTAGEFGAAGIITTQTGIKLIPKWNTAQDAGVCPVCEPLDGETIEVWGDEFPDGPPAHPACRCFLDYDYSPTLDDAEGDEL